METITIIEKVNRAGEPIKHGKILKIDGKKLIGVATKSLYIRKGYKNDTLFLSQRGHGGTGAGDICNLNESAEVEVNKKLFDRLTIYAKKANAIIK